ncbi:MAG TPA: hypothetical protein PL151_07770 [Phycisphaerae bacterium]|nr:hypothetical protein [Phycisphaerae bacterium]HOJ75282.1 hypothetical protein [Phycisphaerae bacterium]HOM53053.1 hypothetical protein [Phycisphaerae bacterium]HOQ88213.1 hypothetical protein [Phycisphaerae bacterium]HPP28216.1 hypothetical protein [Phycisphaerae bacterium]
MKRFLLILWLAIGPSALLLTAGCEQKVQTFESKTTVQESEPRMVSPGTEVIE